MCVLAFDPLQTGAAAQHPVKLLHHQVNGFVKIVGGNADHMVVAAYFEVSLGDELFLMGLAVAVMLELNPHANDVVVVLVELLRLCVNHVFDRIRQIHVKTGDDDIMLLHILPLVGGSGLLDECTRRIRASIVARVLRKEIAPTASMYHCIKNANSSEYLKRAAIIVITGGSSGIGAALIKAILKLSPDCYICNLSRSKPDFFIGKNGLHLPTDLADVKSLSRTAEDLAARLEQTPPGELILINNSGFGDYGRMGELEPGKQLQMIDVNVRALVELTGHLLPALQARGGVVVNIASTAAFQPTPYLSTYGATKAFVLHWTLALNEDLRGSKVRALAVCPGPTRSNFFRAAGFASPPMQGGVNAALDMSAEQVAERTWWRWRGANHCW